MQVTIFYPQNWSEVKYKDYLQLHNHLKDYEEDNDEYQDELLLASAIYLHKVPAQYFLKLPANVLDKIKHNTSQLLKQMNNLPLVKTIWFGKHEYGFTPDLEHITYGEYLDLVEYAKDFWKNTPIVMSILYRPITKQSGKLYDIEPYNGTNDDTIQLFESALTMDIIFGAASFFLHLQTDLANSMILSSAQQMEKIINTVPKETLAPNGDPIHQSFRSLMATLQKLIK
jgi:hypothetical protein